MQQKVDNLCEQLNNGEEKPRIGAKIEVGTPLNETFGSGSMKVDDCGCWICYQHREQFKVRTRFMEVMSKFIFIGSLTLLMCQGNYMVKNSSGSMTPLPNETEQEERRMSDLSDWASSVTSASEIQVIVDFYVFWSAGTRFMFIGIGFDFSLVF